MNSLLTILEARWCNFYEIWCFDEFWLWQHLRSIALVFCFLTLGNLLKILKFYERHLNNRNHRNQKPVHVQLLFIIHKHLQSFCNYFLYKSYYIVCLNFISSVPKMFLSFEKFLDPEYLRWNTTTASTTCTTTETTFTTTATKITTTNQILSKMMQFLHCVTSWLYWKALFLINPLKSTWIDKCNHKQF